MAYVAISAQVVSVSVTRAFALLSSLCAWFPGSASLLLWNLHCLRVPWTVTGSWIVCVHTIASGKQLCPPTCARVYNLTDTYGFKRAVLFFCREGSDRYTPVATLPNLISVVFRIYRKPILESRLSAVSFGILVVAETAVDYKYLYEERPKQWRILIETTYRIRPVTHLEGQGKLCPRQDQRPLLPHQRWSPYRWWATPPQGRR